ncbi:MAG TPA: MFS transporter [Terriglobia bacterium]|nr:MFS transporter [Terriglobia bacterium]
MNPGGEAAVGVERAGAVPGVTNARRWAVVGLLFTASLINYLDRATISMALPLIGYDLHLGPETKGILLSAFFWSYATMQIPIGWCADRFNLRWLYAAAFAVWSLAQGLTGIAGSLAMLIAFRVVLGVGESIYLPGGTKIVTLLFRSEERGLPCGLFDFGTRTGLVLEGLLIPWLLVHYGWRSTFAFVGFTALLWLIPWLLVSPRRLASAPGQAGAAPSSTLGYAQVSLTARPQRQWSINRNLLGICLGFFCFDYYWYVLVTWLPDYLVNVRHLTVLRAGIYTALPFFVFGISEPIGGWIADRLIKAGWNETRTRKGIVTLAFATGICLLPAMRVASAKTAVILIIGASLVGLATGNLIVILQCCAPVDRVGIWTGAENFAGNIAGILAPLATGFLISRTGSYTPGFALGPMLLLAGLLSYWFIVGDLSAARR